jgi:exopolysaccharide biosynthesis polyprenyl glycosylphosphotransferase
MVAPTELGAGRDAVIAPPSDSIVRSTRWVSPVGGSRTRQETGWRIADAVLAVGLLVAVVVVPNLDQMPQGLGEFLAIRLSIKNVILIGAFAWAWPAVLAAAGLYSPSRLRTGQGEWPRLAAAGVVGFGLALVFPLTSRSGVLGPVHALLFSLAIVPAAGVLRASARALRRNRSRAQARQVLLVGSGPLAAEIYRQLMADPLQTTVVLGLVDSEPHEALAGNGTALLGGIPDLEDILMKRVVDDVFIGLPAKSRYEEIRQSLAACARVGVPASYSADLFGGGRALPSTDGDAPPVLSLSAAPSAELLFIKRMIDLAGAVVLLVLLAPLMVAVGLAVKLTSPGPVLFGQDRYGYKKRLFRMYKFRTMVADAAELHASLEGLNEASGPAFKIRQDPRVTRLGRILRRTSLDELPQLWHVLTGEMSLVGPRPMAVRDVGQFKEPWLMRRFSVRPGLTCLWQISDRSDLSFDRWIALDLEYIARWSLWLDLKILIRTIPAVIRGAGAM